VPVERNLDTKNFIDDEELQAALARSRQAKLFKAMKMSPEELAKRSTLSLRLIVLHSHSFHSPKSLRNARKNKRRPLRTLLRRQKRTKANVDYSFLTTRPSLSVPSSTIPFPSNRSLLSSLSRRRRQRQLPPLVAVRRREMGWKSTSQCTNSSWVN
jgi:hypothetical protein